MTARDHAERAAAILSDVEDVARSATSGPHPEVALDGTEQFVALAQAHALTAIALMSAPAATA